MKKSFVRFFTVIGIMFMFLSVSAGELHCNPKTKVCHKEGCRYYNSKSASVVLKNEDEAKKKGYKFCKRCFSAKKKPGKK